MSKVLAGKRALIYGGGTGIGYGCAHAFLENGASVFISARRRDKLEEAKSKLSASGKVGFQEGDAAAEADVDRVTRMAVEFMGGIDTLIVSAGKGHIGSILTCAPADFDDVQRTNVRAPFLAALNVDGRREWLPPHPDDTAIAHAFARHQHGDKGFGPALGPDGAAEVDASFKARGYRTGSATGAWRVGAHDGAMLAELIDGTAAAAADADPALTVARWRDDRHEALRQGTITLTVGHVDILAEPDESPAAPT